MKFPNKSLTKTGDKNPMFKHGLWKTKEFILWQRMHQRCYDKNKSGYHRYGGRGIIVCERWHEFLSFYKDMGKIPEGLSIDRIDPNGNYEPNNCRWASPKEQANNRANNRLITFLGETKNISQWAKEIGISKTVLSYRLSRGWAIERALTNKKWSYKHGKYAKKSAAGI